MLSSEYCRAAATARLLGLGPVETTRAIMNMRAAEHVGGHQAVIRRAQRVLSEPPPPGTNVIIVGHGNLMRAATGAYTGEGGSGIYAPEPESGKGFELVARLSPDDWTRLKARFAGNDQPAPYRPLSKGSTAPKERWLSGARSHPSRRNRQKRGRLLRRPRVHALSEGGGTSDDKPILSFMLRASIAGRCEQTHKSGEIQEWS